MPFFFNHNRFYYRYASGLCSNQNHVDVNTNQQTDATKSKNIRHPLSPENGLLVYVKNKGILTLYFFFIPNFYIYMLST